MEMLSWCFPCCCPPATSSLVTSELKLIEEPRSIRPGFRQRLQSDNEDDPGLCSDSEVLDPGATSAGSPAFRAAGSGSLPQRSDKLMLLGSQAKRSAGEEQRSLRSAGGEVGKADEHRAATKNQRKAGWEDGSYSDTRKPLVGDTSQSASDYDEPRPPHPHALKANGHMHSVGHIGATTTSELAAHAAATAPRRHSDVEDRWLESSPEVKAGATITSVTIVLDDAPVISSADATADTTGGGYVSGTRGDTDLPEGVVDGSPRRQPTSPDFGESIPQATCGSPLRPQGMLPPSSLEGGALGTLGGAPTPVRHAPASQRSKSTLRDGLGEATELASSGAPPTPTGHESFFHLTASVSNVSSAVSKLKLSRQKSLIESSAPVNSHGERLPVRLLPAALNKNKVHEFGWVAPVLQAIVTNAPVPIEDLNTGVRGNPLFVVCGGCPNSFCGMQAVLYARMQTPAPALDFWWIKPDKLDGSKLERATLNRHSKGEHKNDPGRSRSLYAQFADLFAHGGGDRAGGGKLRFEIASCGPSPGLPRALIVDVATGSRYFIHLIWQEDWTSNPFARSKYIKGKIVYQRDPGGAAFFARPYAYRDGVLAVPPHAELEESVAAAMPSDAIQARCLDDS